MLREFEFWERRQHFLLRCPAVSDLARCWQREIRARSQSPGNTGMCGDEQERPLDTGTV